MALSVKQHLIISIALNVILAIAFIAFIFYPKPTLDKPTVTEKPIVIENNSLEEMISNITKSHCSDIVKEIQSTEGHLIQQQIGIFHARMIKCYAVHFQSMTSDAASKLDEITAKLLREIELKQTPKPNFVYINITVPWLVSRNDRKFLGYLPGLFEKV